jgi:hypothetical protein
VVTASSKCIYKIHDVGIWKCNYRICSEGGIYGNTQHMNKVTYRSYKQIHYGKLQVI